MKSIVAKSAKANYLTLSIVDKTTNRFVEQKNNAVSYDQLNNCLVLYWANDFCPIYEDIIESCQNLVNVNRFNLNIDYDAIKKAVPEWASFMVDRIMYMTYDGYSLKTLTHPNDAEYVIYTKNDDDYKHLCYLQDKNSTRGFISEMQDMPPNILNAEKFSDLICDRLSKCKNLKIKVLDRTEIEKEQMNLVLAVNAASKNEPRVVVVEYMNNPDSKEIIALVGKGITMDTGGYSLKAWKSQQMMKFDMTGGAVVCSTMELLAKYQPKVNVVAVACVTDNLIGGSGTVTDSVIKSMNGITVEIENTDCEGRLVLADGVTYAIRKMHASRVITVATLTGAAMRALGVEFSACFTNCQDFLDGLCNASKTSYERMWQLPLTRINTKNQQHSRIADIWNEAPSSVGGPSNGAGFVQQFVEGKPFIHLDICGSAGLDVRHGTGVMCSTLADYLIAKK